MCTHLSHLYSCISSFVYLCMFFIHNMLYYLTCLSSSAFLNSRSYSWKSIQRAFPGSTLHPLISTIAIVIEIILKPFDGKHVFSSYNNFVNIKSSYFKTNDGISFHSCCHFQNIKSHRLLIFLWVFINILK